MPHIADGPLAEESIASAATCSIGGTTKVRVEITGTTTITSFGTAVNKIRWGRFSGALTLTHNATSLILPGGANITTAAGDTFFATSDGSSNWRVHRYTKANGKSVIGPAAADITDSGAAGRSVVQSAAASDVRTAAGLGTAATQNTGTSGANVPLLNGTNTHSGASRFTSTLAVGSSALVGGVLQVSGDVATYQATGSYGQVEIVGASNAAKRLSLAINTTDNVGSIAAMENAVAWYPLVLQQAANKGVIIGQPTGGDKGAGALNAVAVYDDNVLLTCYVLEAFREGKIDISKWDEAVPNRHHSAYHAFEQEFEDVEIASTEMVEIEGGFVVRDAVKRVRRPVVDLVPVWDVEGNGIAAVEVPVGTKHSTPARVEERQHEPARRFAAGRMDELDPARFTEKWAERGVLPGLPTPEEWTDAPLSTGAMIQRLWELCELQAVHIAVLDRRLTAVEKKRK